MNKCQDCMHYASCLCGECGVCEITAQEKSIADAWVSWDMDACENFCDRDNSPEVRKLRWEYITGQRG